MKNNIGYKYTGQYGNKTKQIEGTWVDIDTEFLYINQLNTKPILDVSEGGLRIYTSDIDEIIDDERIGRSYCNFCSTRVNTGESCRDCNSSVMIEFFPGTKREQGMKEEILSIINNIKQN